MFRTLRHRLMLSHVLPVMLIVPIIGIALIYVLETSVLLPELADELTSQAQLIARLTINGPEIWANQAAAQTFVNDIQADVPARIEIFDVDGLLLASSDPGDDERLGQLMEHPALPQALQGQEIVRTAYSRYLHAEIADVLYPVVGHEG